MDLSAWCEVERDAELLRRDGVLGARWSAMRSCRSAIAWDLELDAAVTKIVSFGRKRTDNFLF